MTGALGQDAFYLFSRYLNLAGPIEIYGFVRNISDSRLDRFKSEFPLVDFIQVDIGNADEVYKAIMEIKPDKIYNLAGISSIQDSWRNPALTHNVNYDGFENILKSLLNMRDATGKQTSIYQASSSEVFGNALESPQTEDTSFRPINPYGESKAKAHELAIEYQMKYGLNIAIGILYNHESPMRTSKFVSKKIAQFVSAFDPNQGNTLELGNIEARRDWGYAGDYVVAMNRMLDLEKFGTYVIATGVQHSVRDFLNAAFLHIGVEDWSKYVAFNEEFNRKTDHNNLVGDSSKAFSELGWKAETPFSKLVQIMVDGN